MEYIVEGNSIPYYQYIDNEWVESSSLSNFETYKLQNGDIITLLTWNIWFDKKYQKIRYPNILETVESLQPTFLCFQEVTDSFLRILKENKFIQNEYFISDNPNNHSTFSSYGVLLLWKRNLNSDSGILRLINLPSKMNRKLLLLQMKVDQTLLRIGTSHLESLLPNANYRATQFKQIEEIYESKNGGGSSIICGDFNFCSTWDENNVISSHFVDVWSELNSSEDGWTEDTKINIMRFKEKEKDKQVRFDRILLFDQINSNSSWHLKPVSIELIGTLPVDKEKEIWPSDHFGLFSSFEINAK